jgi:hypothetical protein
MDWYTLLVPAAVLAALSLFRFVGCVFDPQLDADDPYVDLVRDDHPLIYYRLQDRNPGAPGDAAADETGRVNGTYTVPPPLHSDPAYLSRDVAVPGFQLEQGSIMLKDHGAVSVRFGGAFVSARALSTPLENVVPPFSIEAIVLPEWDVNQLGFFYAVMEHSMSIPGQPPFPNEKNAGFALYAGPEDPANAANSPYTWQFWVGTGTSFQRCKPLRSSSPLALVQAEPTYLAVTFNDTPPVPTAFLYVYTAGADVDFVRLELERPKYLRAFDRLSIGIGNKALVGPFPSPQLLYPFLGRMAEVAIYDTELSSTRVAAHIMGAFDR